MPMTYLRDVASVEVHGDKCRGCGMCLAVCPHRVLEIHAGKATIARRDACMECGACWRNCPHGAITVDAGVGCAYAIWRGMLYGTPPDCSCGEGTSSTQASCSC